MKRFLNFFLKNFCCYFKKYYNFNNRISNRLIKYHMENVKNDDVKSLIDLKFEKPEKTGTFDKEYFDKDGNLKTSLESYIFAREMAKEAERSKISKCRLEYLRLAAEQVGKTDVAAMTSTDVALEKAEKELVLMAKNYIKVFGCNVIL